MDSKGIYIVNEDTKQTYTDTFEKKENCCKSCCSECLKCFCLCLLCACCWNKPLRQK